MKGALLIVAAIFLAGGTALAQPNPLRQVDMSSSSAQLANRYSTLAAQALTRGDARLALSYAMQGLSLVPNDGWLNYTRGIALGELGRTDEAVASLRTAERNFAPNDAWARSVAMYGRAQVLANVGRCAEAAREFDAYAAYVRPFDPEKADAARGFAASCPAGSATVPRELATLAIPGTFDAAVVAYSAELGKLRAAGGTFGVRRSLGLLADAFERIPHAAGVDVVAAARAIRTSEAQALVASPGQAGRNLAAKQALTAAANTAVAVAAGPYRVDPEIMRRAQAFKQAADAIDASPTLRHAPLAPIIVALERANVFLKAVATSP